VQCDWDLLKYLFDKLTTDAFTLFDLSFRRVYKKCFLVATAEGAKYKQVENICRALKEWLDNQTSMDFALKKSPITILPQTESDMTVVLIVSVSCFVFPTGT